MSFAATLIDDVNRETFIVRQDDEEEPEGDIFIGLYEEETDTACGVLSALVVPAKDEDSDSFALEVLDIYIADEYKSVQGEIVLLRYLQELALLYGCGAVFVTEYESETLMESREKFFEDLGFFAEDKKLPLYEIGISDIKASASTGEFGCLDISDLSDEQWKQFISEASVYSFDVMDRSFYEPKTSIFLVDDNGEIVAGLLTAMRDEKLYIEGIAPFGGNEEALIGDMIFWEKDALGKYYKSGDCVFMYMFSDMVYNRILKDATGGRNRRLGSLVSYTYEVPVGNH